jgi:hypothetical protein
MRRTGRLVVALLATLASAGVALAGVPAEAEGPAGRDLEWEADDPVLDELRELGATPSPEGAGTEDAEADPGEWQSPFLCTTEFQGLGQPIVDNQDKRGTPVYPLNPDGSPNREAAPLGWSEGCQAETVVEYRYRDTAGELLTVPEGATDLPADIAWLDVDDLVGAEEMDLAGAEEIPYLLRYERGTLPENRFLYSIAMLVPWEEVASPDPSDRSHAHWNGRLLFRFDGGVAIGHTQGGLSTSGGTMHEAMRLGHAVLYTSGTRTSTHYNLMLGGRTAVEAKALFVAEHGAPVSTVGIGGSGGGIQQYVYAQNHPDLLDGLIPQASYPDMTTQTIHIGDCELLEHFMDVTDADNPRWRDWDQRRLLEGLNSIEGFTSEWQERLGATGSSECIEGWRGSTPLAMNPTFGFTDGMDDVIPLYLGDILAGGYPEEFPDLGRLLRVHEDPEQWVEWTHWADVREVYGTDPATGLAQVPWDNVGVQYGLRSVAEGSISPEEFLELNAKVGSWKEPEDAVPESCAVVEAIGGGELALLAEVVGMCEGDEPDWYSSRQMHLSTDPSQPAPRRSADVEAIRTAFESGLVFTGRLPREVPIIDARLYLEHELDMHNSQQSFGIRERIRQTQGHTENHAIWFLDARPEERDEVTSELVVHTFRVMDEWIAATLAHPTGSAGEVRPAAAADGCFDNDGVLMSAGEDVWNGAVELITSGAGTDGDVPEVIDGVTVGACAAEFPLFSTSRIVAGAPVTGDVYKCRLQPVDEAIAAGLYGDWTPTADEVDQLEAIFPNGVCDYRQPGVGDPRAPAFVARFTPAQCRMLDRFVDVFAFADVEALIRNGVRGFTRVADAGGAEPLDVLVENRGPCEYVVEWSEDEQARIAEIAAAWGVDVDGLHHLGGLILYELVRLDLQDLPSA